MRSPLTVLMATMVCLMFATGAAGRAEVQSADSIRSVVDRAIRPMMAKDGIPGAAVAITTAGRTYLFDYGVASTTTRQPVTRDTLFEVGSISKTFTATLASWAQARQRLSLSDDTAKYLPFLQGSEFGNVSLLELGTHTPGGIPQQVPAEITNDDQLMRYLKSWRQAYPPGTYRTYSNVGIGTLGLITAKSLGQDFSVLMERQLLPALGMTNTFINVPQDRMADYAQGYTEDGKPVRMSPGELWAEAYGIRTTATDLARYLEINMGVRKVNPTLEDAITQTHTGYFKAGPMTQDLIWEQYPYPVTLKDLLEGNAPAMILNPNPVARIEPPEPPRANVWINKTGSTAGFGAYVAFVPAKQLGIVILVNKSLPIADRIITAYKIAAGLERKNAGNAGQSGGTGT